MPRTITAKATANGRKLKFDVCGCVVPPTETKSLPLFPPDPPELLSSVVPRTIVLWSLEDVNEEPGLSCSLGLVVLAE